MAVEFGAKPYRVNVNLARDARFAQALRSPADKPAWPTDVAHELRFVFSQGDPVTWTATVAPEDDHLLTWSQPKQEVNALLDRIGMLVSARWFGGDDYYGKGTIKDVT